MFVLINNVTPRRVVASLRGQVVQQRRSLGWDEPKNGDLLDARAAAGFEVLLATDKNIRGRQSLPTPKIAIVLPGKRRWQHAATPGSFTAVVIPER
jgi:hypothetical protein